jgi:hypothetical protein
LEITRADLIVMLHMQKELLRQSILDMQALMEDRQNLCEGILALATKPTTSTELPIRSTARKMVDAAKSCGGAQVKHHFKKQPHQFHGDGDQVQYALSLFGKWINNDEAEFRKTQMTNQTEWGTALATITLTQFSVRGEGLRRYAYAFSFVSTRFMLEKWIL